MQLAMAVQDELRRLTTDVDTLDELAARRFGINRTDMRCVDVLTASGPMRPSELAAAVKLSSTQLKPFPGGGSFMWTISDGNHAYLYNGPQLGFSIPELFVEFEVHSPSQDVRGVSAAWTRSRWTSKSG